ncbi:RILP proteinprotein [Echinococcus multilocularis]|uniref:RILP proteinprotein n=1 Tax=Echinococcus multilocularis TaxID=6211 RepID=A0A068YCA3_ECHMU|nr:RILP proteinprotein [Echinococcus multilocularis]
MPQVGITLCGLLATVPHRMLASSEWKPTHLGDNRGIVERGESPATIGEVETWDGGDDDGGGESRKGVFVTVAEVYEMAAAIGKEFEAIIDRHGGETVCGLMSKVIHVLEELEEQAARRDGQLAELTTLQAAVERLEADKVARTQQRLKDEQDTLKIEENWRAETSELQKIIEKLVEENTQLAEMLESSKHVKQYRSTLTPSASQRNEEVSLFRRLKDVIDAQKVELRSQRRILAQRTIDLDAMKLQAERMAHLSAKGTRLRLLPSDGTSTDADLTNGVVAFLAGEIKELEMRLRAKRVLIEEIRRHINPSSAICQEDNTLMTTSMRRELIAVLPHTEDEIKQSDFVKLFNTDDKLVAKSDTPGGLLTVASSPRFTCDELRQILLECMQLESKIIRFRDYLDVYRRAGDDEPPVQGPINREPSEKSHSWSRSSTNIKLVFAKLMERIRR